MLSLEQTHPYPGAALIRVAGRLTLGENSQELESMVTALIQDGCRNVIFDLSELSQIDSTGIGRFIAGYRQMMAAGGVLRMAAPSDTVRAAFHVTRLDSVFPFFETLDEALRAGQE